MKKKLAVLGLTGLLAVSSFTTAFAEEKTASWAQDAHGWWIQYNDGTYLTNAWYQSPDSGLWYYMGADGYMLTNITTPDGYYVNADGVWVDAPVVDDAWVEDFLEYWVDAYFPAEESASIENPEPIKFTVTMPCPEGVTVDMVTEQVHRISTEPGLVWYNYGGQYNYRFNVNIDNGIITIVEVFSTEEIPDSMLN